MWKPFVLAALARTACKKPAAPAEELPGSHTGIAGVRWGATLAEAKKALVAPYSVTKEQKEPTEIGATFLTVMGSLAGFTTEGFVMLFCEDRLGMVAVVPNAGDVRPVYHRWSDFLKAITNAHGAPRKVERPESAALFEVTSKDAGPPAEVDALELARSVAKVQAAEQTMKQELIDGKGRLSASWGFPNDVVSVLYAEPAPGAKGDTEIELKWTYLKDEFWRSCREKQTEKK